tara:strand:+ start:509 stop:748 length:240 start_codon:yes stop_codon:yes gene_type:complete
MITFDSVKPPNLENLRIGIACDFFFENYGGFLDRAVKEGKTNIELVDTIEEVFDLAFEMANLFVQRAALTQEENDLEHI